MPELPEVETVRTRLEPVLMGRRFEHVEIHDPRLVRPYEPAEVAAELEGERVAAVERRGKYLIFRFESGRVLLIHLRMTGNLRHGRGLPEVTQDLLDDPHRRAVVRLDDGSDVSYRDVRRFGTWLLLEPGELEPYLAAKVGEEPLDVLFTAARLGGRLAGRRAPVKAALLDQRTLAGTGNIYGDELAEPAVAVEAPELRVAPDRVPVDQDLRHRPAAGQVEDRLPEGWIVVERDLLVRDPARVEQRLRPHAVAAPARRVDLNPGHCQLQRIPSPVRSEARSRLDGMAGRTYKTEAVVLRSFRLGEADRVLHLYTLDRGRVGAVAKGVRKTKSRYGARLEPLSHVELLLHQGSGELQTVTGVELVRSHHAAREDYYRLSVGLIGAEAMLRLYTEQEGNQRAFTALTRFLDLLDESSAPPAARAALDPLALSFQLKLLWLSGYLPHLTSCANCGTQDEALIGYSPAAGGAVCAACGTDALALSPAGIAGIETLLARPLADAYGAGVRDRSARDALAVITAAYEYFGNFRLRTLRSA